MVPCRLWSVTGASTFFTVWKILNGKNLIRPVILRKSKNSVAVTNIQFQVCYYVIYEYLSKFLISHFIQIHLFFSYVIVERDIGSLEPLHTGVSDYTLSICHNNIM